MPVGLLLQVDVELEDDDAELESDEELKLALDVVDADEELKLALDVVDADEVELVEEDVELETVEELTLALLEADEVLVAVDDVIGAVGRLFVEFVLYEMDPELPVLIGPTVVEDVVPLLVMGAE
ncbi:hypothetical protein LTR91_000915 [Friedmanniomyces endolithicus]|uniref:Uncharacterized protein n=1 Tax=Friedmanniomyces endolithicus TaxID=329885 RepID=A0AAN6L1N4_9PEZI|nr:hypothetical protein LTR94_011660 [Friedmanniomyces endolithicus]KAK0862932.1 hypothetical protein LTS02_006876 [Friedmanniomyces endolithicus]KAK0878605.1 hypothetical protein LTR87_007602 [Friedmanniomyces endolithicus]KAK1015113.1 hypothetical protein LTR91_000915 [Friedmanniomyces endolithicus]KAK1079109.1 hypothetical protein LTR33_006668 [Friedmanniomyces endolithicus]